MSSKPLRLSGLLRTSTSPPSWIFEAHVPVPKVVTEVLVFVHGLCYWWATFWDTWQEWLLRSPRTETKNLEMQNGEDVGPEKYLVIFSCNFPRTWTAPQTCITAGDVHSGWTFLSQLAQQLAPWRWVFGFCNVINRPLAENFLVVYQSTSGTWQHFFHFYEGWNFVFIS